MGELVLHPAEDRGCQETSSSPHPTPQNSHSPSPLQGGLFQRARGAEGALLWLGTVPTGDLALARGSALGALRVFSSCESTWTGQVFSNLLFVD